MNYKDLDINARINLKGTYEQFLRISVSKFRRELDKKVYGRRMSRKGAERSRTLYKEWDTKLSMGAGGLDTLKIDFPMHGRFIDMGVGRGVNMNAALLRKRFRVHKPDVPRKPIKWYSRRKTAEEKKLSEVLAKQYGIGLVKLSESLLNNTVTIKL
ncbi:hypothetical protein SAMN05216327_101181 [Dyadobacter sp. SG02]|uniref:hypothetical protein n=1 Tax=Dyadobacter sp. SG02 TaxID=1855291 RepID=UPI0008D55D16|nr:hypothetical protein [Dyadobacter sp. SG02]SEI39287.1 hypothetical protein SAMN05216327_101181 [Dyadobacter sp. SG02]